MIESIDTIRKHSFLFQDGSAIGSDKHYRSKSVINKMKAR